jgi:protease-4
MTAAIPAAGCHEIPFHGRVHADAQVAGALEAKLAGALEAKVDVRIPPVPDPGPMVPVAVRPSAAGPAAPRVALVDVDGLILNQNLTGLYSVGENPVSAFREKLEAAAADPRVRALVVRINSPGGGVTATDILAEELRRFRNATGKPTVACLMDLATGGGYYLAVGCDRIVAHPTAITGGVGALVNHFNLQDAMGQLALRSEPIKSGELIDMGSILQPLTDESRALLQGMANSFGDRFQARVARLRPGLTEKTARPSATAESSPRRRLWPSTWSTASAMSTMPSTRPSNWPAHGDRRSSCSSVPAIQPTRSTPSRPTCPSRAT